MLEFYNERHPVARKQHRCECCKKIIDVGERYNYSAGKYDGDFFVRHLCLMCSQIFSMFCTDALDGEEFVWDEVLEYAKEKFCKDCECYPEFDSPECLYEGDITSFFNCDTFKKNFRAYRKQFNGQD